MNLGLETRQCLVSTNISYHSNISITSFPCLSICNCWAIQFGFPDDTTTIILYPIFSIGYIRIMLYKNKYRVESARLENWDYSSEGFYFITICTKNRVSFFGKII